MNSCTGYNGIEAKQKHIFTGKTLTVNGECSAHWSVIISRNSFHISSSKLLWM